MRQHERSRRIDAAAQTRLQQPSAGGDQPRQQIQGSRFDHDFPSPPRRFARTRASSRILISNDTRLANILLTA
jgi:hypothetical protein